MAVEPNYKDRYGEWALVLGASNGTGEAISRGLAQRGMNLVMVSRSEQNVRTTAEAIARDFGVETRALAADVTDPATADRLIDLLKDTEISFFVYNCAAMNGGEFIAQSLDRHLAHIQGNCITPTRLLHHFAPQMAQRGRGGIVLVASLSGAQGAYAWVTYGASKAYEQILAEGLWYELREHGVGAAALLLGATYTPNFQRLQKVRNTAFAETRTPDNLPDGAVIPQEPAEAAATLFNQIDREWVPLIYANPQDEARVEKTLHLTRAEKICLASDGMRASLKASGLSVYS